jgi:hypothetical protein
MQTLSCQPRRQSWAWVSSALIALVICGGSLLLAATASAADFTWSGGGGYGADTWSNAANWEGGATPSDGETIETLTLPRLTGVSVSTNNLTGLTINHLQADGSQGYAISGDGLTLGSGGLTLTSTELPFLALSLTAPLTLSSSQTWNVSGPNPSPPIFSFPEVEVGSLTGENADLTINLHNLTFLSLESFRDEGHFNDELGNVTIQGSVVANEIPNVGTEEHDSVIELPARFNASDGHRLTVREVAAYSAATGSATGPITAEKASLGLNGPEIGAVTAVDSSVVINGQAAGLALDAQSSLGFLIHASGDTPGEDYEQLTSVGTINLGGGEIRLSSYENSERKCPPPPVGQVYTLVSTVGSLSGTFSNAPNGSTVIAECVATASGPPVVERVYSYRISYNTSGSPKTVTATALPAVPVSYAEEPPTITGTTTQGQTLSEAPAFWSNDPNSYSYQWERCNTSGSNCEAITGATAQTYTLTAADVGSTVRVEETAINNEGESVPATSGPTAVVKASSGGNGGGGSTTGGSSTGSSTGSTSGSNTTVAISSAQIAALLRQQLIPSGKAAKIGALLKAGGLTMSFTALEAGTLVVGWYEVPEGAKLAKHDKAKPVLVASGQMTFLGADTGRIKVRLTAAGKRLLKHAKRLKLTAQGRFTPKGGAATSAMRGLLLTR